MRWNSTRNNHARKTIVLFGSARKSRAAKFPTCADSRVSVAGLGIIFRRLRFTRRPAKRLVEKAQLPRTSEEFSFASTNGKIYLFGGNPSGDRQAPPGLVRKDDPAADRWTQKKNTPLPAHHLAAVGYTGKIYLFGGAIQPQPGGPNQFPANNAWEYDPVADSWKALAPMPTARMAPVAAEVDGKIYVIGGASVHPGAKLVSLGPKVPHQSLNTNEVYDPVTNTWQTRMTMPTPRNHAAAGVVNGKIYVIGGRLASAFASAGSNTDVVEVYDPAANTGAPRACACPPRAVAWPSPRSATAS